MQLGTYITIGVILLISTFNFFYWFLLCDAEQINVWEIRWYIFTTIFLLFGTLLGVLRLYNAVVVNSRFLMRLKGEFGKIVKSNDSLERVISNTKSYYSKLIDALRSLKESINQLKE